MSDILSSANPSDFHHITARLKIPLAPVFLTKPVRNSSDDPTRDTWGQDDSTQSASNGPLEAVNQSIASLLMKYIPSLGSVLVSYLQPPIFILQDSYGRPVRTVANKAHSLPIPTVPGVGWGVIDVEVKLLGWRPTIGQKLIGRPTLSSPSHLSLVVYQTFNATIHENHLKAAGCYYDLNVQVPRSWKTSDKEAATPENPWDVPGDSTSDEHKECGCWVDADGKVVGGEDGTVSFTVVSLTVANHMISVIGSLLDDPFSIDLGIPDNPQNPPVVPGRIQAEDLERSSSEEEEERPNYRRTINKSITRIESPPPVKTAQPKRFSRRISANSNPTNDLSEEDDVVPVERPTRNARTPRQIVKTPRKKKLKRPAPETDDQLSISSSSPPPLPPPLPIPPKNTSTTTPSKRRGSSVKPKVSSTTPKKKSKTK